MPGVRDTFQCSFSAFRIGFRRCWQFVLCHKPLMFVIKDHYDILCLGLTGVGKSTLLANLVGESTAHIEPTKGFNIKTLPIKDTIVCIKEIGGSPEIQPFWDYYFNGTNALLFIINAACSDQELKNSRDTLKILLSSAKLKNKPCMILATHYDLPNAKPDYDLEQYFQNIMHGYKWTLQCCSSFEKEIIINILEVLIDLITSNKK